MLLIEYLDVIHVIYAVAALKRLRLQAELSPIYGYLSARKIKFQWG